MFQKYFFKEEMILKRMDIIRTVVISAALGYASCQSVYQAFMDTSRRGYNIVFAIIAIVASVLYLTQDKK